MFKENEEFGLFPRKDAHRLFVEEHLDLGKLSEIQRYTDCSRSQRSANRACEEYNFKRGLEKQGEDACHFLRKLFLGLDSMQCCRDFVEETAEICSPQEAFLPSPTQIEKMWQKIKTMT